MAKKLQKKSSKLNVSVQDSIPEFIQLLKRGRGSLLFSHTALAVEKLSTMYQEAWINAATGALLPGLPFVVHGKQYQHTIQRRQISRFKWEVYSDYATKKGLGVTALLEAGHAPIDLKPGLLHGPKSKQGKNGRYNIVSFRHGSPGADENRSSPMPLSVYKSFTSEVKRVDTLKKMGASAIPGTSYSSASSTSPSGISHTWGIKYDQKSKLGAETKTIKNKKGKVIGEYTHKSGKYAGMVRLQQSTAKSKRGGYFTFRVVSAHSDPMSWIVPEKPPWPVRKAVVDFMKPFAEGILKEAMEADIK